MQHPPDTTHNNTTVPLRRHSQLRFHSNPILIYRHLRDVIRPAPFDRRPWYTSAWMCHTQREASELALNLTTISTRFSNLRTSAVSFRIVVNLMPRRPAVLTRFELQHILPSPIFRFTTMPRSFNFDQVTMPLSDPKRCSQKLMASLYRSLIAYAVCLRGGWREQPAASKYLQRSSPTSSLPIFYTKPNNQTPRRPKSLFYQAIAKCIIRVLRGIHGAISPSPGHSSVAHPLTWKQNVWQAHTKFRCNGICYDEAACPCDSGRGNACCGG